MQKHNCFRCLILLLAAVFVSGHNFSSAAGHAQDPYNTEWLVSTASSSSSSHNRKKEEDIDFTASGKTSRKRENKLN
jgi:hypothetical protein